MTTTIACNNCGAPLAVGEGTRFVTCLYCQSQLEVYRTGSSAYTQVLERIGQQTERMADDLSIIRLQNDLERIDREWSIQREQYLRRDKQGHVSEPGGTAGAVVGIVMGLFMAGFGLFWTTMAFKMGAPSVFPLFGLIFVVMGLAAAVYAPVHAQRYQQAKARYERERQRVLDAIAREGAKGRGSKGG